MKKNYNKNIALPIPNISKYDIIFVDSSDIMIKRISTL